MKEFLHGWRRKTGCLALIVAIGLMGAWLSSQRICETVEIPAGGTLHRIVSKDGTIQWCRYWSEGSDTALVSNMSWVSGPEFTPPWILLASIGHDPNDSGRYGFSLSRYQGNSPHGDGPVSLIVWMIPYWSVVIPLTFLAACLLLCEPRKVESETTK